MKREVVKSLAKEARFQIQSYENVLIIKRMENCFLLLVLPAFSIYINAYHLRALLKG